MSDYEDQWDDSLVICPYCGNSYQRECEDYSEDERIEDCGKCGQKYYTRESFSVSHCTTPDCELNGTNHNYQLVDLRNGKSHPFCTICGKCQPLDTN